jgi:hypothetical protein
MPRAVPGELVALIDRLFPWARQQEDGPSSRHGIMITESEKVAGVLELYERIPQELIRLEGQDLAALSVGIGALRDTLNRWTHLGAAGRSDPSLLYIAGYSDLNPITLVRRALVKCPDQAPAPATAEFPFIPDGDLREALRTDFSEAERAFADSGWKAATVLGGSVVEALLLWALQQRSPAERSAACATIPSGTVARFPALLEEWTLHQYTEVAATLGIIKPNTAALIRLAKDYRNLIHPGRAQRLGQLCDRGTARAALAAVDAVVRDLT